MLFTTVIKGIKRLVNEEFKDYRNRITAEKETLKRYLKGRLVKPGSAYIPKSPKDRKATKKKFRWKKAKAKRQMQKLSRRKNRK